MSWRNIFEWSLIIIFELIVLFFNQPNQFKQTWFLCLSPYIISVGSLLFKYICDNMRMITKTKYISIYVNNEAGPLMRRYRSKQCAETAEVEAYSVCLYLLCKAFIECTIFGHLSKQFMFNSMFVAHVSVSRTNIRTTIKAFWWFQSFYQIKCLFVHVAQWSSGMIHA